MKTFKQFLEAFDREALLAAARSTGVAQQFTGTGGYSKASNAELEQAIRSHPAGAASLERALLVQKARPYLDEVEKKGKIFIPSTTLDYEFIKTWLINYLKNNNKSREDNYEIIWSFGPLGLRLEKRQNEFGVMARAFDDEMRLKYGKNKEL